MSSARYYAFALEPSDEDSSHLFSPDWPEASGSSIPLPPVPTISTPAETPTLPSTHFLALARAPWANNAPRIDTATVAAADFDVDSKTGFMPPHPPVVPLPRELGVWEETLLGGQGLTLGVQADLAQRGISAKWRRIVESMPILSTDAIRESEVLLRRAHHVLAFILHLYIHSQPPPVDTTSPIRIPRCLSIPLIQLSKDLILPPILTYSDNVLYNWTLQNPSLPLSQSNIRMVQTFSQTESEQHFYITSARIELRGVEALDLMRSCMDEAFIGDAISLQRLVQYLTRLSLVIDDMTTLLAQVREGCDPGVFYNDIRPWFRGWETGGREWLFEGVSSEDQAKYARLSGPSAGQSSLIHALDVFLGVDHAKHGQAASGGGTFLMKMETYMPRHHRAFLTHLRSANQTHVRSLILTSGDPDLEAAYDSAVLALKRFRDGHIRIATLYIVSQARAAGGKPEEVRGTGGTSLVPFLKECRDNTLRTSLGEGQ